MAPPTPSIFAAVVEASTRPAARRSRRAMLAISRAIEDACAASGESAALVGSFQREDVFRRCERRWVDLARGSQVCVALADFATGSQHDGIVEVPTGDAAPMRREWSVAVLGPHLHACLAGWEWPGEETGYFEAIWSVDRDVVVAAVQRGLDIAGLHTPDSLLQQSSATASPDALQQAMRLMDRIVDSLDRTGSVTRR
jgi:DICT domain-containing protein